MLERIQKLKYRWINNQKVHQYHNNKKEEEGKEKKSGEKGLGCGGRGLSKGKFWVVGGAYA